jgi:acetate kinase
MNRETKGQETLDILVINSGSSSIKYTLIDPRTGRISSGGRIEKIGEAEGVRRHWIFTDNEVPRERTAKEAIPDHVTALESIAAALLDEEIGVLEDPFSLAAVGHRVVHGGENFHDPTIIDDEVLAAIRENIPLAPLHNPPNLAGIEIAGRLFPGVPQVAVFDTAFHLTLPREAFLYGIPLRLYEQEKVRKYGFHGISHSYVSEKAAAFLGLTPGETNLVTLHLGNGASMAAVRQGRCVDTSMGMSPLEGLVMGTRCGDVDPSLHLFLAGHLGISLEEIDDLLNRESGLKGLCGTNDMREILSRRAAGDRAADDALGVYVHRIRKYIGAFCAVLGRTDALVFTAGVGENSPVVRELCCRGLEGFGIGIDEGRNCSLPPEGGEISSAGSPVKVLVIPTKEELKIALETQRVLDGNPEWRTT